MSTKKITNLFILLVLLGLFTSCQQKARRPIDLDMIRIDPEEILLRDSANIMTDLRSHGFKININIDTISAGVYHVMLTVSANRPHHLRELKIPLHFMPDSAAIRDEVRNSFHWVPNLKKKAAQIISQHVFRSPAIILTHKQSAVSIIPDLNAMNAYPETPYYLDLNFGDDGIIISYGLSNYKVWQHVYYERKDSSFILPEKMELGLYAICSDHSSPFDILKKTNAFLWDKFGSACLDSLSPQVVPFHHYADAGYTMGLSKYWVNGPMPGTGGHYAFHLSRQGNRSISGQGL